MFLLNNMQDNKINSCLDIAKNTLIISSQVAQTLAKQSEDIKNINNAVVTTDDNIKKADKILNKMKNFIVKIKNKFKKDIQVETREETREEIQEEIQVETREENNKTKLDELLKVTQQLKEVNLNISRELDRHNNNLCIIQDNIESNIINIKIINKKVNKIV